MWKEDKVKMSAKKEKEKDSFTGILILIVVIVIMASIFGFDMGLFSDGGYEECAEDCTRRVDSCVSGLSTLYDKTSGSDYVRHYDAESCVWDLKSCMRRCD